MKITINKEDLLYAIGAVEKAVSGKNTLPVLSGVLIEIKDGQANFRATDMELAIQCTVPAQVEEEGVIVAPGRKLSALARLLPDVPILLSSEAEQLTVEYAGSSVKISCLPPEDFPLLPEASGEFRGVMPMAAFRRLIRQVSVAAAADELRPVFTGVYTEFDGPILTLVATDTHRLAKGVGRWEGEGQGKLIIPSRVLQEAARLAAGDDDMISIVANRNQIFFSFHNLIFTSRMIVGQYPDYRQVIPAAELFCAQMTVEKKAFTESLERAALIARNVSAKSNTVRLVLQENGVHICAEVPDEGRIDELLPAQVEGELLTINYNVKYLLDAVKVLDGDAVRMRFTGSNTPGLILSDAQPEEEYLYLLLPVRMSR